MTLLPSIILLAPDTYIYIIWCLLFLLSAAAVLWLWLRCRRRWPGVLTVAVLLAFWGAFLWGSYGETVRLEVRHVEYSSPYLPAAFDGYRVVHLSDLHTGTLTGRRAALLQRVVDSINAQHPDLVCFTGDLQNKRPQEIEPHQSLLASIKAADGMVSVLGNHDYTNYLDTQDPYEIYTNMGRTIAIQEEMGWRLLNNSRLILRRDSARIVIAGMENDGEGRFPQLGDLSSALRGISRDDFVIMLEHDPTSWRRKILPHSHTQLTLSGHTHGGQLSLLGWSPASLVYREHHGLYHAGPRAISVSSGVSGVVPFRLGTPPEIVVITLKTKKPKQ